MTAWVGWVLVAAALWVGWRGWGWQGLVFAFTLVVFWLLLQFNRSVRVMRDASQSPVGHVDSAVMLQAKLRAGLPLMQIVRIAKSLGRRAGEQPEVWEWTDAGGATVAVTVARGRATAWSLRRADAAESAAGPVLGREPGPAPDEAAACAPAAARSADTPPPAG